MITDTDKLNFKNMTQYEIDQEFIKACKSSNMNLVKYLLTSKELYINADIQAENSIALWLAVEQQNLDLVSYLLSSRELSKHVKIRSLSNDVFILACEKANLEIIKYLLTSKSIKEKSNLYAQNNSAFLISCTKGSFEVFNFLLNHHLALSTGAVKTKNFKTSKSRKITLYERGQSALLSYSSAKKNINNSFFQECLTRACENGHLEIVKCLVEKIDLINSEGAQEALKRACYNSHLSVAKYLIVDKNIKKTANITSFLSTLAINEQVELMFSSRQEVKRLNSSLLPQARASLEKSKIYKL